MRNVVGLIVVCVATAILSTGQILTTLANFNGPNGAQPTAELIKGHDGNFYGTTSTGGDSVGSGTVFTVTSDGQVTTLHVFDFWSGIYEPLAPLFLASDGNFYGTTYGGSGAVYKITPQGSYTTLHTFGNSDGLWPFGGLVEAGDGNFYGTTTSNGINGDGTVFRITPAGVLTTLHFFSGREGAVPLAGLVLANDGNLYGTTAQGGDYGSGTVFRITTDGTLTTLHSFNSIDGALPAAALIQASDGNLYGTTAGGGTLLLGTVFKITLQGSLTTLHNFTYYEGQHPNGLVQANDGSLYGTTEYGGFQPYGTIFQVTLNGTLTILYTFTGADDGSGPRAGLAFGNDGNLYGTTWLGGTTNQGVIFRLPTNSLLVVTKSGQGTVSGSDGHIYCGSVCSYPYTNGRKITLSAVPAPGYTFSGWIGCDNVNGSYCFVTIAGAKNVTATFTPFNVTLTSLTFKPSYVKGGQLSAGTLILGAQAPPGGLGVALSSDHPTVAHPPSWVIVPGGKSSVQFAVNTFPVKSNTMVTITATAGTSQMTGTLMIGTTSLPPSIR